MYWCCSSQSHSEAMNTEQKSSIEIGSEGNVLAMSDVKTYYLRVDSLQIAVDKLIKTILPGASETELDSGHNLQSHTREYGWGLNETPHGVSK